MRPDMLSTCKLLMSLTLLGNIYPRMLRYISAIYVYILLFNYRAVKQALGCLLIALAVSKDLIIHIYAVT